MFFFITNIAFISSDHYTDSIFQFKNFAKHISILTTFGRTHYGCEQGLSVVNYGQIKHALRAN